MKTFVKLILSLIVGATVSVTAQTLSTAEAVYNYGDQVVWSHEGATIGSNMYFYQDVSLIPSSYYVEGIKAAKRSYKSDILDPGKYTIKNLDNGVVKASTTFRVADIPLENNNLRMLVISDAHVMAQSLVKNHGTAYTSAMDANRKMLAESEGIYNQLVDTIIKYKPDVVLFPGDVTKDGEKASHEVFVEGLKKIEKNGIVCLVIPGNHDYNNPSSVYYDGADSKYADALNEAEFATMYKDYGYGDAATRDTSSLSFYTDEFDHLRIIGIDATRNRENTLKEWGAASNKSFGDGLMRPNTLKWVLDRADEANAQGRMVLAMVHHQMLQHFDNEDEMFSTAAIQNGEDIATQFIDHNIRVVLTGHMHINNITKLYNTAKTDSLIEISTGSPIEYPGCWRWLSLNKGRNTLTVNTRYIASIKEAEDFMLYGREHLSKHDDLLWSPFSTKLWDGMAKASIADADLKAFLKLLTDDEATYKPIARGYLSEPLKLIMLASAEANENHKYGQLLLTMMSDSLDVFAKKVMTDNSYSALSKVKVSAALKLFSDAAFDESLGSLVTDCSYRGTKNENTTNDLYLTVNLPNPNGYVVKNTVNFVDWDGKILKTQEVGEGGAATAPADPTRNGYTFTGWDTDFSVVDNDLTVTALYKINSYTVTFVDKDGKEISQASVEYGSAATAPTAPTVEGYTFTGWDKDFSKVTTDMTVTAQYKINTFTVTFKDFDGKEISKQTVDWGKSATAPKDPTREGYTFTGWDKDFSKITANLTVTAQYKINTYTVTFVDKDGKEISKVSVEYGSAATAPTAPTVEGYTFTGWDKDISKITANLTVTAQYKINTFTVTFVDYDGTVLKEQTVDWGKAATAPSDPKRDGYTFVGWSPADFSSVKENITITAQYSKDAIVYTVTFVDWNGNEILSIKVIEGNGAEQPADPERYGYTFIGWDKDFSKITSDLTVTAQYKINTYTVTFLDKDGNIISKETVEFGSSATAPEAPAVEGYTFTGWDKSLSKITGDITVIALYKINTYTVTFVGKDGKEISKENVEYGATATAPEAPIVEGFEFIGWDIDFSKVTSDLTVTALYEAVVVDYTPANLRVEKEQIEKDTKITFSWDAVDGAASYELQLLYMGLPIFTNNTSTLHEIPIMLSELLAVITGIEPGTYTLGWQVRSLDSKSAPISEWAQGEDFEVVVDFGTGLEVINGETKAQKVMRNGRVVIISNEAEFNTAGTRLK